MAKPFNGPSGMNGRPNDAGGPANEVLRLKLSRHQNAAFAGVHHPYGGQLNVNEALTIDHSDIYHRHVEADLQLSNPPRHQPNMIMTEFGLREAIRDTPRVPGQANIFTDKHLDVNDAFRAAQKADMERFNLKGLAASRHASRDENAE
jgi:hypothetical protein